MDKLNSGDGALKSQLIDVITSDKDIAHHLEETLHADIQTQTQSQGNSGGMTIEDPCFPFLCRDDPHFKNVEVLVANFANLINANKITPGDLLLFSHANGLDEAFLLGIVLKKPRLHTLMEARVSDKEVQLANGGPRIVTTHQLFLTYLRSFSVDGQVQMQVEAWRCQAFVDNGHQLKSNPVHILASFTLSTDKLPVERKQARKLPLGLKLPSKRQKQKTRKAPQKSKSSTLKGKLKQATVVADGDLNDSDSSSSSSSSNDTDINKESERAIPPSETVALEEKSMQHVAKEIEDSTSHQDEKAQTLSQQKGTFFNKELGLQEGAIAASGRSVRLHCKMPISRGAVRFSWAWSRARPPGWIHGHCTLSYIKANSSLQEPCIERLRAIISNAPNTPLPAFSSSSSQSAGQSEISSLASKILESLQR